MIMRSVAKGRRRPRISLLGSQFGRAYSRPLTCVTADLRSTLEMTLGCDFGNDVGLRFGRNAAARSGHGVDYMRAITSPSSLMMYMIGTSASPVPLPVATYSGAILSRSPDSNVMVLPTSGRTGE